MGLDLTGYLARFQDICQTKFGRTYDFGKLEKRCDPLRTGKRWLVARDVMHLFDPNETPLAHYWGQPNAKEIDSALTKSRIFLNPIPFKPDELVRSLLGVFHNLGHTSIILRFVHPARFAIFSAPVSNIVQVHRANAIDLYLAYCEELREWKEHFKLQTVAETEMALWSFDQLTKQTDNSPSAELARRLFDGDLWIQRRRAALVLRPLLNKNGPLELAKILVEENPRLAGKLGAEEYERLLRLACKKYYRRELPLKPGATEYLLDQLANDGHISFSEKVDLDRVWELRNRVVHPGKSPNETEIEWMLDLIERVCSSWDSAKCR